MIPNMVELHYLADNFPVSVNANFITHFFDNEEIPISYNVENHRLESKEKIKIRGTRICLSSGNSVNVMESYEEVKNKINASKKKEST